MFVMNLLILINLSNNDGKISMCLFGGYPIEFAWINVRLSFEPVKN